MALGAVANVHVRVRIARVPGVAGPGLMTLKSCGVSVRDVCKSYPYRAELVPLPVCLMCRSFLV